MNWAFFTLDTHVPPKFKFQNCGTLREYHPDKNNQEVTGLTTTEALDFFKLLNNANMFLRGQMWWTLETINLVPTRESLSPAVLTFLLPIHPCFFLAFLLHRTLVHRNHFFSQALHMHQLGGSMEAANNKMSVIGQFFHQILIADWAFMTGDTSSCKNLDGYWMWLQCSFLIHPSLLNMPFV